jgi:phosphoglycolate phosphatase-like HAD superfamily hydrolase
MRLTHTSSSQRLWLFLDFDATIFAPELGDPHREALRSAVAEQPGYEGVAIDPNTAGRTDRWILEQLVKQRPDAARLSLEGLAERATQRFRTLCPEDLTSYVLDDVRWLLAAVAGRPQDFVRSAPLTGNLPEIARIKVERARLEGLAMEYGGYGNDAAARSGIFERALERAGNPSPKSVVVIGDTPYDIECARSQPGTYAIGVTYYGSERGKLESAGPDCIAASPRELLAALETRLATLRS